jgi:uncharacterized membrane protein YqiK
MDRERILQDYTSNLGDVIRGNQARALECPRGAANVDDGTKRHKSLVETVVDADEDAIADLLSEEGGAGESGEGPRRRKTTTARTRQATSKASEESEASEARARIKASEAREAHAEWKQYERLREIEARTEVEITLFLSFFCLSLLRSRSYALPLSCCPLMEFSV